MANAADLQSKTSSLTVQAFETFAEDIGTMFDTEVEAQQVDIETGTAADLKDVYKKLAAICSVKTQGALDGHFHVVFDKDGLFTLAGTFVMQPEQIILQNRKSGTEEEAAEVGDALGEVGNLLVGAWDRIFREGMRGHGHFVQSGTFYGNPWTDTAASFGVDPDESLDILTFEITVDPLPPFRCAALYPSGLFNKTEEAPAEASEPAAEAEEPVQEAAEEQTPEEAPAAADPSEPAPPDEEESPTEPVAEEAADPAPEPLAESDAGAAPEDDSLEEALDDEPLDSEPIQPDPIEMESGPVSEAIRRMTGGDLPAAPTTQGIPGDACMIHELCAVDAMRKGVPWASPEDSIEDLIGRMQQFDCGYILIGTDGKLEGIVSKSDIRGALSPYLQSMFVKWRTPMDIATLQIKAKWAMNRPVRTVRPDATLAAVMHAMIEHGGRCMPVVDEQGKVQGIVTVFDVFSILLDGAGGARSAGHIGASAPIV